MKRLGLLLLLAACATGPLRKPVRPTDRNARMVQAIWYSPYPGHWQRSGWYRAHEDVSTPSRVVISVNWEACIMPNVVDEPKPRDYYVCPTPWRVRRH